MYMFHDTSMCCSLLCYSLVRQNKNLDIHFGTRPFLDTYFSHVYVTVK